MPVKFHCRLETYQRANAGKTKSGEKRKRKEVARRGGQMEITEGKRLRWTAAARHWTCSGKLATLRFSLNRTQSFNCALVAR